MAPQIRFCLLFFGLLKGITFQGYASEFTIRYLGIEDGLSNNAVTCITQDKYGFIWMGTYDGLNRYNGDSFKVFRNIWGDQNSLVNNHIKSIIAIGGRIYVGTEKGLMFFDYADSRFHPLYCYNERHQQVKIGFNINEIAADKSGNIFVTNGTFGLLKFGKTDTVGREVFYNPSKKRFNTLAARRDKNGIVWVLVSGVGLGRYDAATEKIQIVAPELANSGCMTIDGSGKIIAGTGNELLIYDPVTLKTTKLDKGLNKLNSNNIFSLTTTKNGNIWVATNGGGIKIWDPQTDKVSYINAGETPNSLRSGAVDAIFEDDESRIWIATLRGGVNIIDRKPTPFRLFAHDPFNKNSVINNFILSFCEDDKHNVWVGTDGGGLSYWNTGTNTFEGFVHQNTPGTLSSNFVVSIIKDYKDKIWTATFNGGIDAFDNISRKFKHYTCYNPVSKTEERNFWKLYEDSQHRLWAGSTWGGALFLYNRAKDQFELFDNSLVNIHALYEDHAANLWGGNYNSLIKIDAGNKKHQTYFIGQAIRAIIEDNKHHLWIGTEGGGLLQYDINTHQYKRYTEAAGLPSNTVLNILVDNGGNLWCSTYNGLSNFNVVSQKFTNYYASDGLQSNQFNYNAALKLASGKMLFGGIRGFNLFSPDSIAQHTHQPRLVLSDLKINNVSIELDNTYTQQQPLNELKELTIPFSQAILNVNYTALEYSFPEKISYAYYLEGWDHGWNFVGKLKSAYFSRLNEGTYILKIRATNTEGAWVAAPIAIKIVILPPWYRTWWAYAVYLSLLFGVVYGFYNYRINQARLKFKVKLANLQVEKEKELNEKKLAFFTNVSHEFRTPLTLIINPIKDLLRGNEFKDNEELNTIYRNSRRLLGLVDHLLLFRKTESENDNLNLTNLNFTALCNDVYQCFVHQAKIKNIGYRFIWYSQELIIAADREKMEIALFNLISNALKFTPDGGEVLVRLYESGQNICLEVADNGCGIAEGTGEKLFDKFYQLRDGKPLKTGFGIGLYLVKSFIKSHGGDISYEKNKAGGTTFTMTLPKTTLVNTNQSPVNDEPSQHLIDELLDEESGEEKQEEINNLELLISDKQSVLIIDDNKQMRSYIGKIFKENYKTYEADNGEAGLEMIRKYLPDVVVSDISMGELSGIELCRLIKQDTSLSHIPVILLTGDANPEVKLKGIEVGAVDFVNKPFEKDLLFARVQGILKDRRHLQNYFYNEVTLKANSRNISEHHKEFLYKCIAIIENYLADPDFDVKTIANEMGMGYSSLFKKIKLISGLSVNGFVRFVRLRKAAELMINTNCNVNEAALKAGFNDIKYFRQHFVKLFGVNPSEFIKQHRQAFHKKYFMEQNFRQQ